MNPQVGGLLLSSSQDRFLERFLAKALDESSGGLSLSCSQEDWIQERFLPSSQED